MASNLVFYSHEDPSGASPTVIYCYDNGGLTTGNLIGEVQYETNWVTPVGYVTTNYAYDQSGDLIGYFSQQRPAVIAATPDGRCYAGSAPVQVLPPVPDGYFDDYQLDYFRVYRSDGRRLPFPQLHGARIRAIAVDSSGNLYVAGDTLDTTNHYVGGKYNSAGTLQWRLVGSPRAPTSPYPGGQRDFVYCIAVDSSGNVYTGGGNDYEYGVIKKYNSSGVLQWEVNPNNIVTHIVVDSSGNVYTALDGPDGAYGIFDGGVTYEDFVAFDVGNTHYHIIKWSSAGAFISGITFDPVGGEDTVDFNPRLFAGDGLLEVTYYDFVLGQFWNTYNYDLTLNTSHDLISKSLAVAPDGTVYHNTLKNPLIFSGDGSITTAVVETDQVMSLAFPLALGIPLTEGDRYSAIPALAFRLSLAVPVPVREYTGTLPLPSVFRLELTGGTGTVELPLASFQIRRNTAGTWLSVVIPTVTAALVAAIESRTAGNVILRAGVRFPDGTEQLDQIISAPFSSVRYDAGARSASLSIEAAGLVETGGYARTARGINYRSAINGLRRVRCAVDAYLRPGDLLDLGEAETMTVGDLSVYVDATRAMLEAGEAAS